MRTLFDRIWKRSSVVTNPIDARERRLIVKAVVIGVFVWAFVYPLKVVVHGGFHQLAELIPAGAGIALISVPLVVGALVTEALARHAGNTYYRGADGKLHKLNVVEGDGLERAISLYFTSEPGLDRALLGEQGVDVRWRLPTLSLALRKFAATTATLCTGGSGGLEASVTLIGESLSATLLKPRGTFPSAGRPWLAPLRRAWDWWRVSEPEDLQAAQLCGVSAAIATLLGAPFAGAFFAVEVMYRRRPIIDRLIYALVSALVAFFLTHLVAGGHPLFELDEVVKPPIYELRYYGALVAVAFTLTLVAIAFRKLRSALDDFFHHRFSNPWLRHALGALGTAVVVIGVAAGLHFWKPAGDWNAVELVLGPGENMMNAALAGKVTAAVAGVALAAKLVATLTTITSGGSAGLLFPTMFFGSMVAAVWAEWLGFDNQVVIIAPAMCASLVSIVNVPLAAILLTVEVFGASYVVPAMVMVVLASVLARQNNIYRAQRETFEKGQILPGFSVRRVRVPDEWAGSSIAELRVRSRFGITVIGLIDRGATPATRYTERNLLNPPPEAPLGAGNLLIVLGPDTALNDFEHEVSQLEERQRERQRARADEAALSKRSGR